MTKITYTMAEGGNRRVYADGEFIGVAKNRDTFWYFRSYNSSIKNAMSTYFKDLARAIVARIEEGRA